LNKNINKICICTAFYPPHTGGVERYVEGFSKQLAKAGFEVIILTSNTENQPDIEEKDNVKIILIPQFKLFSQRFPIPKPNRKYFQLIRKLSKENPDVYIMNMRIYLINFIGLFLSKILKKKSILIEHVSGHFIFDTPILNFLGRIYEHLISFILRLSVNKFYGVSQACNDWLKHFNIKSNGIIYNGININIKPQNDKHILEENNIPEDSIIITFAGRLIAEKGIIYLLDAFNQLINKYENLYLFIAGDGPLLEIIKSKYSSSKNIIPLGRINHEEVLSLLNVSDIVINPSYYPEGLSTLLLEAGLYKCAVITTSMGGTNELITNQETGLIIEPKSEQSIIEAIELLISNSELRTNLASCLQQKVTTQFTWEKIASQFIMSELSVPNSHP
jgi:glycosyltransferase involved in cell wall biosynthesis